MVSLSSDYTVAMVDIALHTKEMTYVTLKKTPYVGQGSPSSATTIISKINVTCYVLIT